MVLDITATKYTEAEAARLKRDMEFYFSTPRGSLPQMRNYGIDYSVFDLPVHQLQQRLTVEIITGMRGQFGINPQKVTVTADENGVVTAAVVI
ncbi:MAG: hypothetical protein Q4G33_06005 [bacterium]|nr:hypothetical protein [bacterium]